MYRTGAKQVRRKPLGVVQLAQTCGALLGQLSACGSGLLVLGLALTLNACGFHLRSSADLPPQLHAVHVAGIAPYSELARALTAGLSTRGGASVSSEGEASARLVVLSEDLTRRTLSVDVAGKATEYTLHYVVGFELRGAENMQLVKPQRVSLQRDFRFDPTQVLGAANEDTLIRREMTRAAADQIIQRLSVALGP